MKELSFPTFKGAETTSPIDDGGKELEDSRENYLDSSNMDYISILQEKRKKEVDLRDDRVLLDDLQTSKIDIYEDKYAQGMKYYPEAYEFIKLRRGSRGKMAIKNSDLFILWG